MLHSALWSFLVVTLIHLKKTRVVLKESLELDQLLVYSILTYPMACFPALEASTKRLYPPRASRSSFLANDIEPYSNRNFR